MKLALGTVQFGLAYGIANTVGQVPRDEVARILARATEAGIDTLDTAAAYGDAEQVLGMTGTAGWRIVTKVPALPAGTEDPHAWVHEVVSRSLAKLGTEQVDAVLLHRAQDLAGREGAVLWAGLRDVRDAGLSARIGLSIYGPDDLAALPEHVMPDIVQAPFSVFDRRLETSGWADRLAAQGTALHIRSAFLQGLLLMPPAARPARFRAFDATFARWTDFLAETGQAPLEAALGLALSRPWAERVLVGVDSAAQLADILDAAQRPHTSPPDALASGDPKLIDPRQWDSA